MSSIYSRAASVLACLGKDRTDAEFLFDTVNLTKYSREPFERLFAIPRVFPDKYENLRDRIASAFWRFTRLDYWDRLWIVQETYSAQSLHFLVGNRMIDLPHLLDFSSLLAKHHIPKTPMHRVLQPPDRASGPLSSNSLPSIVRRYSECLCADNRDHVYALLSFVVWEEGENRIEPDYTESSLNLCLDLVELHMFRWNDMRDIANALKVDSESSAVKALVAERISTGSTDLGLNNDDCEGCGQQLPQVVMHSDRSKITISRLGTAYGILVTRDTVVDKGLPKEGPGHLLLGSDITKYIAYDARHGDILLTTKLPAAVGRNWRLCIIVRHSAGDIYQIIGQGFLKRTVALSRQPLLKATLFFDGMDFLTLAVQDMKIDKWKQDPRMDARPSVINSSRPRVKICVRRFSSYASVIFAGEEDEQSNTPCVNANFTIVHHRHPQLNKRNDGSNAREVFPSNLPRKRCYGRCPSHYDGTEQTDSDQ